MIFNQIERISNLLRAEERKEGGEYGLQAVHMETLYYLSKCNRFSDTPASVTEYLQLTKGTVSQSLRVVESKGLIKKQTDACDRRVIHLKITARGKRVLANSMPPSLFSNALEEMPLETKAQLQTALDTLIKACQKENNSKSFDVCGSWRYCQPVDDKTHFCGLTKQPLSNDDIQLICREHTLIQTNE